MTHRPDHLIDATWEDGDPGQDASRYGHDGLPEGSVVGVVLLLLAFGAGGLLTVLALWIGGVLQC